MKHEKEGSRLSTMRIKELTTAMESLQRELHQKVRERAKSGRGRGRRRRERMFHGCSR